jgi:DNA-directed RNA polymerase specialized sigma24 family protein
VSAPPTTSYIFDGLLYYRRRVDVEDEIKAAENRLRLEQEREPPSFDGTVIVVGVLREEDARPGLAGDMEILCGVITPEALRLAAARRLIPKFPYPIATQAWGAYEPLIRTKLARRAYARGTSRGDELKKAEAVALLRCGSEVTLWELADDPEAFEYHLRTRLNYHCLRELCGSNFRKQERQPASRPVFLDDEEFLATLAADRDDHDYITGGGKLGPLLNPRAAVEETEWQLRLHHVCGGDPREDDLREVVRRLVDRVPRLSERDAELAVRVRFYGERIADVAQALGVARNNADQILRRVGEKLKKFDAAL